MLTSFYDNRLLQLITGFEPNLFYPIKAAIREYISKPFLIKLNTISFNTHIEPDSLLKQPVTLIIKQAKTRYFHGMIHSFIAGKISQGVRYYQLELVPEFFFFHYQSDCRIYQHQNLPEIIQSIWHEFCDSPLKLKLHQSYPPLNFIVQYNESYWNFLHRLMENHGVFYFFEHSENEHITVLSDDSSLLSCCAENVTFQSGANQGICLSEFNRHFHMFSGKHIRRGYTFKKPKSILEQNIMASNLKEANSLEAFAYVETDSSEFLSSITQAHFEAQNSHHNYAHAQSNCLEFHTGKHLKLIFSPQVQDQGYYFIVGQIHHAQDESYLYGSNGKQDYFNDLNLIPTHLPYRSIPQHAKPIILGPQTATVVGPASEEIYTDHFGRIKVRFHWDRHSQPDEKSSCWIRVGQLMAGQYYGTVFIPRVGQEVIVQFLNGDPDMPIIIGTVYNQDHQTPYPLPEHKTKTIIKTQTYAKNTSNQGNELYFEDQSGSEKIYLYAERDYVSQVNHDAFISIGNHQQIKILKGNHHLIANSGSSKIEAHQSITLKVGGNQILIDQKGIFINGLKVKINKT